MVTRNNPLRDGRHLEKYFPFVDFIRRPTSDDIRHPRTGRIYSKPYFWRVRLKDDGTAPDSGVEGELWYLEDITANVADWKILIFMTGGGSQIITLSGDAGGAVPGDGTGDMDLIGNTVAAGTNAKPVFFSGTPGSFKQDLQVQLANTVAPTPVDANDAGLVSLNENQFTIDATSGMASLIGSTVLPPVLFQWVEETTTSRALNVNEGVIGNNASTITMTLPASASQGDVFCFIQKGAGIIQIAQNAGQTIHTVLGDTTTGVTGHLDTIDRYSSFCLICITDDTDFALKSGSHGSLAIV